MDPEHGPGWRLALQPLAEGGFALSLLVSHSLADAEGVIQAVLDAGRGRPLDPPYPAAGRRWSPRRLARDGAETLRALPGLWRAARTLATRPRPPTARPPGSTAPARAASAPGAGARTGLPVLHVAMDGAAFDARAGELGISSNSLLTALAARITFRIGRADAAGQVRMAIPVSDRQPGDRRGNALSSITVTADAEVCRSDPRSLQRSVRTALAALRRQGDPLAPLFPLLPFVPLRLIRHMERTAFGNEVPVGCTLIGTLPPEMVRICGAASRIIFSGLEGFTAAELADLRGGMLFAGYRSGGEVLCSVSGYTPRRVTSSHELRTCVHAALADLGLGAAVGLEL